MSQVSSITKKAVRDYLRDYCVIYGILLDILKLEVRSS